MRCLRAGETVGMLPDQVPGQGDGAWAQFFGEPAYTMTLPLRLAQSTGAGIIWASALRTPSGWRLLLEPWVPAKGLARDADLGPWLAALNERVEGLIARAPQDYLWAYNRFKVPAGRGRAHA
jgi:KDO2-lipid IV(A) lauroyltransferase